MNLEANSAQVVARGGFFREVRSLVRENVREYGMYIALFVIMLIFTILTDGLFMSSRNISNLLDATGYIAVLAVGMTLVIVIRHIDLSVGFAAGFMGAVAAILLTQFGLPIYATIPIVLVLGTLAGLVNGFLVASVGIPAFVSTLAGMTPSATDTSRRLPEWARYACHRF